MTGRVFELMSGSLCLDFANTVHNFGASDPGDDLSDLHDLLSWAEQSGLRTRTGSRAVASSRHGADPLFFAYAKEMRDSIYVIFSAIAAGKKPAKPALAKFNSLLQEAMAHLSIHWSDEGFAWKWDEAQDRLRFIMWNIAYSAARLLTSDDARRVRQCSGPSCTWLFLDRSKNGSRRWCDMRNCGNREKSRRHYARVKRARR